MPLPLPISILCCHCCFEQISPHLKRTPSTSRSKESSKLYHPHTDAHLSPHTHSSSCTLKKVRALYNKQLDHEEHDASIFGGIEGRSLGGMGKVRSADKLSFPLGGRRRMRHSSLNQDLPVGGAGENVGEQSSSSEVTFKIAFSPKENDEYVCLYVQQ